MSDWTNTKVVAKWEWCSREYRLVCPRESAPGYGDSPLLEVRKQNARGKWQWVEADDGPAVIDALIGQVFQLTVGDDFDAYWPLEKKVGKAR